MDKITANWLQRIPINVNISKLNFLNLPKGHFLGCCSQSLDNTHPVQFSSLEAHSQPKPLFLLKDC